MSAKSASVPRVLLWVVPALAVAGCGHEPKKEHKDVAAPPVVKIVSPALRPITRTVGQPSFIESYERTSIYPKMTAYIEKWVVDIGDKVKKGDLLATLFVPEIVEDFHTKTATVELDRERVNDALTVVQVAEANVDAAKARVAVTESDLGKYQSEVDRWDVQVKRLQTEVDRGVISPQILLESSNQLKSNAAFRDAAKVAIDQAKAELRSKMASTSKAKVDVAVAQAVAESDAKRLAAWVGYLTLSAPFDGVITARNANTGDFVLPATGDPTALRRAPDVSTAGAAPIYVVDRLDIVRIFVDIPEKDANFVNIGTKATVLARAYKDVELPAKVTRTSWALNIKSRTLRAEIDLPNPESRLLPGMYAYGTVIIEHPGARALPAGALVYSGDQTYCWLYENGKAVRTELETGVSDDDWVEVTNRRPPVPLEAPGGKVPWTPIDGSEKVIMGDLSILADLAPVALAPPETK
jgi:HlyD family secretion protein